MGLDSLAEKDTKLCHYYSVIQKIPAVEVNASLYQKELLSTGHSNMYLQIQSCKRYITVIKLFI